MHVNAIHVHSRIQMYVIRVSAALLAHNRENENKIISKGKVFAMFH